MGELGKCEKWKFFVVTQTVAARMSQNEIGLFKASQEVFARIAHALRAFFCLFAVFVSYFYLLFLLISFIQIELSQ